MAVPAGLVAVAGAAWLVTAGSGSAQAPTPQTLTFFEADAGSTAAAIDNAPRSPVPNPENPRFRFSLGDEVVFVHPLRDRRGGTRVGTLYLEGTIMRGVTFRNIDIMVQATFALNDGSQISGLGTFRPGRPARVSVTGGTGAYDGARGTIVSEEVPGGSQDTITLLP